MGLQVLVRCNDQFKVHPDHVKQWTEAGGEYGRQFLDVIRPPTLFLGVRSPP